MPAYLAQAHAPDDELELFAMLRLKPSLSLPLADHLERCVSCCDRLARALIVIHNIRLALADWL